MERPSVPLSGSSAAWRAFATRLDQAARSEATVLLQGESGTGKSVAARLLHQQGSRRAGPLIAADLAARAPSLLEAALFGHERGAFTDAGRERRGLFRRAEGGTIVLDDVDLLPLPLQAKLLRALQERVVEPLGAEESVPIDVRVVATTNRELAEEVAAGRFRQDLYYRLAVVTLSLPPLRARTEDVRALVEGLVPSVARRLGVRERAFSEAALVRLEEHPWPGNVRELENAVERVLVLIDGSGPEGPGAVAAEELDFLAEGARGMARELASKALSHGLTVEAMTQAMLEHALEEQRGNVSAAARQVGLTRRAFDYRLGRASAENGDEEE
jgi:two-component system response regulator HydG